MLWMDGGSVLRLYANSFTVGVETTHYGIGYTVLAANGMLSVRSDTGMPFPATRLSFSGEP